ncbi:YveK family protein [Trujillonella endophytica]|uniref:Capsular polysaccharide biosynthesis protein n=1 Tax=Trujillonella endophytica TaxID=673521 RepID=A0A1H8SKT1_9ACTN|nr:Wzz/FepE/Etk N-terminal domain-containing protein [Trujillella endophytica]SEO79126.1 Capsular polysaccharide biosynthesis protein [Trujillella endophytica]
MELSDYGAALRRFWATWVGITLAGLFAALLVVWAVPPTYTATAEVFVASTVEGTNGSQFVNQRVTSYPDVARSQTVLGPVIDDLGLSGSVTGLRADVEAVNPPDTSQIHVSVTDRDPSRAAAVANAVAERFSRTIEDLEQREDGVSPVSLTVTDPATVPGSPVFPVPGLLLGLGLVVGLALGVAVAVLRSRLDTRLHSEDDVRAAWGSGGDDLDVLVSPTGRRRTVRGPVTTLAHRLEPDDDASVRTLVVAAASPDDADLAHDFVTDLATEMVAGGTPVAVTDADGENPSAAPTAQVRLTTASVLAPAREWRRLTRENEGVVLVATAGRARADDLREARSLLAAAGATLLCVVLLPARRERPGSGDDAAEQGPPAVEALAPPAPIGA